MVNVRNSVINANCLSNTIGNFILRELWCIIKINCNRGYVLPPTQYCNGRKMHITYYNGLELKTGMLFTLLKLKFLR